MSPAFISGVSTMLPNSKITFDKFHIVQHLNKALDTVRRDERKGNDLLKNHKYTYLRLNIQPFIKFVGLLKGHWSGIVNYFDIKLTNGILEGINSIC